MLVDGLRKWHSATDSQLLRVVAPVLSSASSYRTRPTPRHRRQRGRRFLRLAICTASVSRIWPSKGQALVLLGDVVTIVPCVSDCGGGAQGEALTSIRPSCLSISSRMTLANSDQGHAADESSFSRRRPCRQVIESALDRLTAAPRILDLAGALGSDHATRFVESAWAWTYH